MKLKDLADHLGLSQTTVSRALNGYPEVSEATRQRVLEAAERYHYRPNPSARRLATGRAGAIGAVLPTDRNLLVDPHFVEFLAGLGERLVEDEMDIVLSRRRAAATRPAPIAASSPATGSTRSSCRGRWSRTSAWRCSPNSAIPSWCMDAPSAARPMPGSTSTMRAPSIRPPTTCSISATGASRSSTAACASPMRSIASRASAGRLPSAGSTPDERLIGDGTMTDEVGYRLTERFLAEEPRPTAFLVSSMMLAFGCLRVIRTAGLVLGRDVSLIAHDDVFPFLNADRMVPPLTTMRSPIRAAGTRVADMVIDLLRGRAPETIHELWPVELVIRASTGPAPS